MPSPNVGENLSSAEVVAEEIIVAARGHDSLANVADLIRAREAAVLAEALRRTDCYDCGGYPIRYLARQLEKSPARKAAEEREPEPHEFEPWHCEACRRRAAELPPPDSGLNTRAESPPAAGDPLGAWPDPTPEMLARPDFEAVWQAIKTWDINVPSAYQGYMGATGNHVRAILDTLARYGLTGKEGECG